MSDTEVPATRIIADHNWMGWTHFLTKTLARVRTEMSLHVLAYNLKRVMRILGIGELMRAMSAWAA